jgi:hypothetical protein
MWKRGGHQGGHKLYDENYPISKRASAVTCERHCFLLKAPPPNTTVLTTQFNMSFCGDRAQSTASSREILDRFKLNHLPYLDYLGERLKTT